MDNFFSQTLQEEVTTHQDAVDRLTTLAEELQVNGSNPELQNNLQEVKDRYDKVKDKVKVSNNGLAYLELWNYFQII